MPSERARNEWSVIVLHDDFLELRWLPSTARLDADTFKATLSWFAAETESTRPRAVLSDIVDLRYTPSEDVMSWRAAQIVPRYASAGVRRFAFLVPPHHPNVNQQAFEGLPPYPTRWFPDRADAIRWISG